MTGPAAERRRDGCRTGYGPGFRALTQFAKVKRIDGYAKVGGGEAGAAPFAIRCSRDGRSRDTRTGTCAADAFPSGVAFPKPVPNNLRPRKRVLRFPTMLSIFGVTMSYQYEIGPFPLE